MEPAVTAPGRGLRRRWHIQLPLFAPTLAVTATIARTSCTQYWARAMASLLTAQSGTKGGSGRLEYQSPFLAFDGVDTAALLTRRLGLPPAAARLRAEGITGSHAAANLAADARVRTSPCPSPA